MTTPSKISRIPGAPADQYPEREVVFPCWAWRPVPGDTEGQWLQCMYSMAPELGYTHHNPDQPEPPTERPETPVVPPAQMGETPQMDAFDRDTLLMDIKLHPHREWRKAVKKGRQLERELNAAKAAMTDPAVSHAMALRYCTPEQLAHLGGENRTAELNELSTLRQQLAQVTTERDESRGEALARKTQLMFVQSQLTAAETELAELRKDKARLDWMQQERASVEVNEEEPLRCHVESSWDYERAGTAAIYNIREAVDMAMEEPRAALHQREGKP